MWLSCNLNRNNMSPNRHKQTLKGEIYFKLEVTENPPLHNIVVILNLLWFVLQKKESVSQSAGLVGRQEKNIHICCLITCLCASFSCCLSSLIGVSALISVAVVTDDENSDVTATRSMQHNNSLLLGFSSFGVAYLQQSNPGSIKVGTLRKQI